MPANKLSHNGKWYATTFIVRFNKIKFAPKKNTKKKKKVEPEWFPNRLDEGWEWDRGDKDPSVWKNEFTINWDIVVVW